MNGHIARRARRALILLCALFLLIFTLLGGRWLPALDWAEAVEGINILFGFQAAPVREADAPSLLNDSDIRAGTGAEYGGAAGVAPETDLRVRPSAARDSR
jgi:hypothetical protein